MKNKNIIIPAIVFIIVLVLSIIIYLIYTNINKDKYTCTDYETNTTYTFKNEKDMHEVCDNFNGVKDDQILSSYEIYQDIVTINSDRYSFYPYLDSDKKLAIIITITDCNNPKEAEEQANKWFSDHSYNINDYQVDYEYPCEQ